MLGFIKNVIFSLHFLFPATSNCILPNVIPFQGKNFLFDPFVWLELSQKTFVRINLVMQRFKDQNKIFIFKELCNGSVLRVFRRSESWKWCIPIIRFSEDEDMRKNISDEDRSRKVSQYETFDLKKCIYRIYLSQ